VCGKKNPQKVKEIATKKGKRKTTYDQSRLKSTA